MRIIIVVHNLCVLIGHSLPYSPLRFWPMTSMWPFFNQAAPNTNIVAVLTDIDARLAARAAAKAAASAASVAPSDASDEQHQPKPLSILIQAPQDAATSARLLSSTPQQPDFAATAGLSPHMAYSPGASSTTPFAVTASELLHSIKTNSEEGTSDVISLTSSNHQGKAGSGAVGPLSTTVNSASATAADHGTIDSIIHNKHDDIVPPHKLFQEFTPIRLVVEGAKNSHEGHPVDLLNLLLDQQNLLDEFNHPKNSTNMNMNNGSVKMSKLNAYISSSEVISILMDYVLVGFYLSKIAREIRRCSQLDNEHTDDSQLGHSDDQYDSDEDQEEEEDIDLAKLNLDYNWVYILESKWSITPQILDYIWNHDIFNEIDQKDSDVAHHNDESVFQESPPKNQQTQQRSFQTFRSKHNSFPSFPSISRALKRSNIASELLILPTTDIEQALVKNINQISQLWRGILNCSNDWVSGRIDEGEGEEDADDELTNTGAANNNSDDDRISITSTDSQKLIEMEKSNQYDNLRDTNEMIILNNFMKLIDDLVSISTHSMMNFLRFEQTAAVNSSFKDTLLLTEQLISHLSHSPTMCDLIVRSISLDKPYAPIGLIDLLNEQHFIQNILLCCKQFANDHIVQDCICGVLNGIVGISSNVGFWDESQGVDLTNGNDDNDNHNLNNPNIGPNDLTRNLVSKECIEMMIDIIVDGGKYGLVTVVSVVIEVIRKNNSDYDEFEWINSVSCVDDSLINQDDDDERGGERILPSPRDPIYLGTLLKVFSYHLPDIIRRYMTKDYYNHSFTFGSSFGSDYKIPSSVGHSVEALGYERFKIMELLAELLHCSNMMLMNKKIQLDFLLCKREMLRNQEVLTNLLDDALESTIGGDSMNSLANKVKRLSTKEEEDQYLPTEFDLSIGNYFKYQLMKTNTVPLITLKIFRFPWNNFMHNVVFDLIQQIFNGRLANWDEDRAVNQVETIWDDNLSLNKNLIWSLFGQYDDYEHLFDTVKVNSLMDDFECSDDKYPGFFNLPAFILFLYQKSHELNARNNFNYGYMGHLTLIAEEIHKFQNYVENFGLTKSENAFGLKREENDNDSDVWWKSSYFVFEELWETIFNGGVKFENNNLEEINSDPQLKQKYAFQQWLDFVQTDLKEISATYNKVLGNPNELESEQDIETENKSNSYFDPSEINVDEDEEDNDDDDDDDVYEDVPEDNRLGLSREEVMKNIPLEEAPKAQGAIILDNGDSEQFRKGEMMENEDSK